MDKPTVLIVDDNEYFRTNVEIYLHGAYHVQHAEDGFKAIEMIAEQTPDVCVIDHIMPGMNGLELLEYIKTNYPYIPTIMITAHSTEDLMCQAMDLNHGAAFYLKKPFFKDEFLNCVNQALEKGGIKDIRIKMNRYLEHHKKDRPENENQLNRDKRMMQIKELIKQKPGKWTLRKLERHLKIPYSTIYRDIERLKSMGCIIEFSQEGMILVEENLTEVI